MQARVLVDGGPAKFDLIRGFLIVLTEVLFVFLNRLLAELLNDLLNRVLQETLERENLLSDKTVLLECILHKCQRPGKS